MGFERARALILLLCAVAGLGALSRVPLPQAIPPPCPTPGRAGDVVVCDGSGVDLGGRAWLFGRKLDVNTASVADLERISGIGRALATRIVDERQRRGRFAAMNELDDVDGVGPRLLGKLAARVEVR